MASIVKILSAVKKKGKAFVKFTRKGKSDVQETQQMAPFGLDSTPIENMVGLYVSTEHKGEPVLVGYIQPEAITEPGESRLFSTDENGALKYYLHMKKDGTAEFGGVGNFLVKFNELKTAFDAFVIEYNTHTHTGNMGGPTSPPLVTSSASIDAAKHDKIKTE